ncbi:MAG: hypothetical protein UV80_C0008G0005 [Candidatus Peregrinibacteria bacterium GW2011_GWF2_43_17]|nr:MAG: hypothetical protein UV80_C0008G0005 [Candidatus Peregrinibacteria bacterium GW2011_GWF2_43_17]
MQVKEFRYNKEFETQFLSLPKDIQKKHARLKNYFVPIRFILRLGFIN